MSQMAHQAGAYPSFCSMRQLGVFLLPPGWDTSTLQGYPQYLISRCHLYTWVERGSVRVNCLAQEHKSHSAARAQTQTAQSIDNGTNNEATVPPTQGQGQLITRRSKIESRATGRYAATSFDQLLVCLYPGPRGFLLILSFFIWKFATRSTDQSAESGEKESLWSRPLRISLSCWLST